VAGFTTTQFTCFTSTEVQVWQNAGKGGASRCGRFLPVSLLALLVQKYKCGSHNAEEPLIRSAIIANTCSATSKASEASELTSKASELTSKTLLLAFVAECGQGRLGDAASRFYYSVYLLY
jgi:hypothetical protein